LRAYLVIAFIRKAFQVRFEISSSQELFVQLATWEAFLAVARACLEASLASAVVSQAFWVIIKVPNRVVHQPYCFRGCWSAEIIQASFKVVGQAFRVIIKASNRVAEEASYPEVAVQALFVKVTLAFPSKVVLALAGPSIEVIDQTCLEVSLASTAAGQAFRVIIIASNRVAEEAFPKVTLASTDQGIVA
jgi:hypothetical protein